MATIKLNFYTKSFGLARQRPSSSSESCLNRQFPKKSSKFLLQILVTSTPIETNKPPHNFFKLIDFNPNVKYYQSWKLSRNQKAINPYIACASTAGRASSKPTTNLPGICHDSLGPPLDLSLQLVGIHVLHRLSWFHWNLHEGEATIKASALCHLSLHGGAVVQRQRFPYGRHGFWNQKSLKLYLWETLYEFIRLSN